MGDNIDPHHFFTGYGPVPSPMDCYLVSRAIKTLPIRMKQHMENAISIAKYLEEHKAVEKVIFPGKLNSFQYYTTSVYC